MGILAALILESTSLARLRASETAEQVREWFGLMVTVRRLGPGSLAVTLVAGLYLAATHWGGAGWIVVALASIVLMAIIGAYSGIRLTGVIGQLLERSGRLSVVDMQRLRSPVFMVSICCRMAIVLGIVVLMTNKPDLNGSTLTLLGAVLGGLAASLLILFRGRPKASLAAGPS
jgi:hypothetical protein